MAGETVVAPGSPLAIKHFSTSLHVENERRSVFLTQMSEPVSTDRMAASKMEKQQTSAHMPIVIVTDLVSQAGDTLSIDMEKIVSGAPFMGDDEMEGRGENMTFDSFDMKIDQTRFPIKAGGRMTRKRTAHNLRTLARSQMVNWFAKFNDQVIQVHLAGARGDQDTGDWNVPLENDRRFRRTMINPVLPPTSNRYFVAGGGANVTEIGTTDYLKLQDIAVITSHLRDSPFPPAPIRILTSSGGEMIEMWCLMVTERQWHYIIEYAGGAESKQWRQIVADSVKRAMLTKHPIFTGECGMWNGTLIKKQTRAIRFNPGSMVKITNSQTGIETAHEVPALGGAASGAAVDRALLVGGQALALARGDSSSPGVAAYPVRWTEVLRDHSNNLEIGGGQVDGKMKMRFESTEDELTDFGVCAIDSFAPAINSTAGAALRSSDPFRGTM
ncbi:MAG: DUF4043 family protein [Thiotrichales bacterium]|nr:DUF4043 family protein [Thiotrichales bacterium]